MHYLIWYQLFDIWYPTSLSCSRQPICTAASPKKWCARLESGCEDADFALSVLLHCLISSCTTTHVTHLSLICCAYITTHKNDSKYCIYITVVGYMVQVVVAYLTQWLMSSSMLGRIQVQWFWITFSIEWLVRLVCSTQRAKDKYYILRYSDLSQWNSPAVLSCSAAVKLCYHTFSSWSNTSWTTLVALMGNAGHEVDTDIERLIKRDRAKGWQKETMQTSDEATGIARYVRSILVGSITCC